MVLVVMQWVLFGPGLPNSTRSLAQLGGTFNLGTPLSITRQSFPRTNHGQLSGKPFIEDTP